MSELTDEQKQLHLALGHVYHAKANLHLLRVPDGIEMLERAIEVIKGLLPPEETKDYSPPLGARELDL